MIKIFVMLVLVSIGIYIGYRIGYSKGYANGIFSALGIRLMDEKKIRKKFSRL